MRVDALALGAVALMRARSPAGSVPPKQWNYQNGLPPASLKQAKGHKVPLAARMRAEQPFTGRACAGQPVGARNVLHALHGALRVPQGSARRPSHCSV